MWDWLRRFLTDDESEARPGEVFPATDERLTQETVVAVGVAARKHEASAELTELRDRLQLLSQGRIVKDRNRRESTARGNLPVADLFADDVRNLTLEIEKAERRIAQLEREER